MNPQIAIDTIRQALMTAFWLGLPLLLVGFLAGIAISLIQIVTSIQDPGFAAAPRLAAFFAAFLLVAPWMLMKLMAYTTAVLGDFSRYAH